MKRIAYPITLLLYLLLSSSLPAKHSLWVWDMADDVVLDEKDRMDFWSFIEAPHAKTELKITTIYLSVGKTLLNDHPRKVSEFIADAHSRGIKVEYLTGDPRWSLTAYNQASFDELNDLLAYNAAAMENERFDGYHQDTEPYTLGTRPRDPLSWGDDTEEIWDQFVATTLKWKSMIDAHNSDTPDDLIMGSAIPFWWDPESGTDVNHETIQDIVDYVSIMNYNTRASDVDDPEVQGFDKTTLNEINYASHANAVYIGMETLELKYKESVDGFFQQLYTPTASYFYGNDGGNGPLGIEGVALDVSFLENLFSDSPSYGGIAFHFYEDIGNGDNALRALGYELHEHAPAVWIISPSHTETLSGIETIDYVVYDPDGNELNVTVEYSSDSGANWSALSTFAVSDQTDEIIYRTLPWDVSALGQGTDYLIRITATENTTASLNNYDQSDYLFSIAGSKSDTANPGHVNPSSIEFSYSKSKEIELWWDKTTDNNGIDEVAGYYVSYTANNPHAGVFSRGNRVRLPAPSVDSMLYIWAVDFSGNLSAQTSFEILAIEDIDQDGIQDADDTTDRDGDGVSNDNESSNGTNPEDPLDFSASRLIGHWKFEGDLSNTVEGAPGLIVDDDTEYDTVIYGSLSYVNEASHGQAIEISGAGPVWLPLETNPANHSDIDALTIEMWIKPDPTSQSDLSFIPLACFGDLDAGLTLLLKNNSDLLSLRRYTGEQNGTYDSINAQNDGLFDGEWHHVAGSYNGYDGMLKLYIDGELVGSGQKKPGSLTNTRRLRFFDGRSNYDDQNGSNSDVLLINSGQFENNFFDFTDPSKIRYIGLADNIKVTRAALPVELLGYYQDRSENYTTWKADVFGDDASNADISDPEVDHSKDGISNFLAYTSGLDPMVNNSANFMYSPIIETKGGKRYLSLYYLQSKTAATAFQVQTQTDLNALEWNLASEVSYLEGESGNSWIKKVSVPFDNDEDRLFIRLKTEVSED